jgi:hypothetical protein
MDATSRDRAAPRQPWTPVPNARWLPGRRVMSKRSGSGKWAASRLADARFSWTTWPRRNVCPCHSTSSAATRGIMVIGVS